ncbi:MAG: Ig-like domain-containing protein, partial [Oscillospiraceae bacterium]|nr:Ig-like domain-containing protein [Oscillospiraceae bacterium]
MSDIVEAVSMPWDVLGFDGLESGEYLAHGISFKTASENVASVDNGIAFEISVPKSETYKPTLTYDKGSFGGIISAYLFKKSVATENGFDMTTSEGIKAAVSSLSPTAVFDTFDENAVSGEIDSKGEITFPENEYEQGEYYLVFSITDKNEEMNENAESCYFELSSLKLKLVPTASANYVFSNAAVGDTETRIWWGDEYVETSGKTLADNNPDVSDPWDLLSFCYAHGAGYDATGFWYRTPGNRDVRIPGNNGFSFEIIVPKDGFYRPTLSFDYASGGRIVSVYMFDKATAEARGFNMATQSGIISTVYGMAPVGTYDSYDLNGANAGFDMMGVTTLPAVELKAGSNYLVFAMTDLSPKDDTIGQPHLEIRSLYLEEIAEEDVDVYTYDFKSYTNNSGIGMIKNYQLTKNWKYKSLSETLLERYNANAATVRIMHPYGIQAQTSDGEWMALSLDIPYGGYYVADFTNMVGTSGGAADIYLSPLSEAEENRMDEKYRLGEVEFGAYETKYNVKTALRAVKVDDAGEYVLVLKAKNSEITGKANIQPTSITLTKTGITGAALEYSGDYLRVGATEEAVLEINTSSGKSVELAGAKVTYESSDDNIATIDKDGNITGISAGNVTFTVTVEIGGDTFSDTLDVLVKEVAYTHAEVNLKDNEVLYVGGEKELSANACFDDGSVAKEKEVSVRYESDATGVAVIENGVVK